MSLQVEKLEHNMAKLTIEVPAEELEKACEIQPCNKTAHTVTYKNIRQCRVLLFHYHRHSVQIVYKVAPAVLFGEKAEIVV